MNDTELDRLLDRWEAPAPPPSLRAGLRDRFPRDERRRFGRPLRWVLAIAVASVTLAVATEQGSGNSGMDYLVSRLRRVYHGFVLSIELRQCTAIMVRFKQSDPKVYVDGQPAAPPTYKGAASLWVDVPAGGEYGAVLFSPELLDGAAKGFIEAGTLHQNVLEFQAGGKQVRIVCNRPVVDADRPVYVTHRR
jgi:hypothetical protein